MIEIHLNYNYLFLLLLIYVKPLLHNTTEVLELGFCISVISEVSIV